MDLVELCKKEALLCAQEIAREGLFFGTWGNLSCRLPGGEEVVITPSGLPYEKLQPQDLAVVNLEGLVTATCRRRPSTELLLHLEIYRARRDVQAVIHTHSKFATVFAVLRKEITAVTEENAQLFGGAVPVAAYALPGTRELAFNAVQALGENGYAVLLANHGAVCTGETLPEAFLRCRVLERSAEILLWSSLLGLPFHLSREEVQLLREKYLTVYGQGE